LDAFPPPVWLSDATGDVDFVGEALSTGRLTGSCEDGGDAPGAGGVGADADAGAGGCVDGAGDADWGSDAGGVASEEAPGTGSGACTVRFITGVLSATSVRKSSSPTEISVRSYPDISLLVRLLRVVGPPLT
jgi:hypothetical protein